MIKDCSTCIHKEGSCYPSLTIFDKDKTCGSYKPDYEGYITDLEKENTELKEKFLKVKADDVRKSKLESFKTFEDKNEYLNQVSNYALFNENISVMFWCFIQRGNIYKDQLAKAKEHIENLLYYVQQCTCERSNYAEMDEDIKQAEQFLQADVGTKNYEEQDKILKTRLL